MKKIHITKKIIITLLLVLIVSTVFSNYSQAIGNAFLGADNFLNKRGSSKQCYRWRTINRNFKFYV